jgi:hypothetical protein
MAQDNASKDLHYSYMVLIVYGIIFALILRLWLQLPLQVQVPAVFKLWGTMGCYFLTCWCLIIQRRR